MSNSAGSLHKFEAGKALVEVYSRPLSPERRRRRKQHRSLMPQSREKDVPGSLERPETHRFPLADALVKQQINWKAVELFHMDEYVGIKPDHPPASSSGFGLVSRKRMHPGVTHYLRGDVPDLEAEIARYSQLLNEAPIDLAFVGFGENGHIAFNDPPVADFQDPATVKIITLDEPCRRQQAGEGHFKDVASVPPQLSPSLAQDCFERRLGSATFPICARRKP